MKIYLVHEIGDDYHGSRVAGAFDDLVLAESTRAGLSVNQDPCGDCGHTYSYSIETIELTTSPNGPIEKLMAACHEIGHANDWTPDYRVHAAQDLAKEALSMLERPDGKA